MNLKSKLLNDWREPNREHLAVLTEGVASWNSWRKRHPLTTPILNFADLSELDFHGADFSNTYFVRARLNAADLRYTSFYGAELFGAELRRANLRDSNLRGARLHAADLREAQLQGADLYRADLVETQLEGSNFYGAKCRITAFTGVDLSHVIGLEEVLHRGPSPIDAATLVRSGALPVIFLRGCGVPDALIDLIPSLFQAPVQFYSCFISYASKDQEFVERLHADLQSNGVRCWFAPQDLAIGARMRVAIDESIRVYDKLLLVLSTHSIASEWVEKEVETAMERERNQKRTIVFPIRIDDDVLGIVTGWASDVRRSRHIGDFCLWKNHDSYSRAFRKLIRDLRSAER